MPYTQEERVTLMQLALNDRELLYQWTKEGLEYSDFCELLDEYATRVEAESKRLY